MTRQALSLPQLGELELAVLEHLWAEGEGGVIELHRAIGKRRKISVNTVGSALERLYRKNLLVRTKVSHAYRYRPAILRDEFAARKVLAAAGGIDALSRAGLLAAFVELVADVDEQALDRLERLIARRRKANR